MTFSLKEKKHTNVYSIRLGKKGGTLREYAERKEEFFCMCGCV